MTDLNNIKPLSILITGGAGFLGSHLIDRIIKRGDHVICLDNLYTSSKENIATHIDNPNFTFINADISDPIELELKVDQIYNLACPASPIHYQKDPIKTAKTSALGALNILNFAHKNSAKIFQASTSEVYGDPDQHPQKEGYWGNVNPIGIRSCYDEGKRFAETVFFDYNRMHDLDIRVGRIFNTYGPRMDKNDGRVVSNFIVQALRGEDITIYGDGNQTRSFCYVDDLIDIFIRFMDIEIKIKSNTFFGPMNIGNPNEFTMKELANEIISITNSKSKIIFCPLPQDDPKQRRPDISIARDHYNWQPRVELSEGLNNTINYFDELLRNERNES